MVRLSVSHGFGLLILSVAVFAVASSISFPKRRSVYSPILQPLTTSRNNNPNTLDSALPLPRPNKTTWLIDGSKQYGNKEGGGTRTFAKPMSSLLFHPAAAKAKVGGLDVRKTYEEVDQSSGGTSMIAISTVLVFATFVAF